MRGSTFQPGRKWFQCHPRIYFTCGRRWADRCVVLAHFGTMSQQSFGSGACVRTMRRLLLSCKLMRSRPVSAFLAAVDSRTKTFPQVPTYHSRLWDSGASNPPASLELKISFKQHFHDELRPCWESTSQLCVFGAGATLPEPLPLQRQRKTHKTPTDATRTQPGVPTARVTFPNGSPTY